MLKPENMKKAMEQSFSSAQQSKETLQQPFAEGMDSMNISGAAAAQDVMKSVNQQFENMMQSMSTLFSGIQDDVDAHQAMQRAEKPNDFETAMADLRQTLSQGFPQEMQNMFDSFPKAFPKAKDD